jgi:hypothetical protein
MVIFSFDYSRKSHGRAVPCADGNGKLWRAIYDLDLPNPIICKTAMALRMQTKLGNTPAPAVEEEEEVVVMPRPQKAKGKGKGKAKAKELEEEVLEVQVVPEVEPVVKSKKVRAKAKVREEVREEFELEEDTAPARKRQRTGALGSSAPKHPVTGAGRARRPTAATSKSSAPTPVSEPPAEGSHRITRNASTANAAATAQEQVGGGAVGKMKSQKKVTFEHVPSDDSDSDSDKFVPSNSKSGEDYGKGKGKCRAPQDLYGTVYSAQDSRPIGKAYIRSDGSYVGEFAVESPPNLPPPAKRRKPSGGVSIPTEPRRRPKPRPKVKAAEVASSTSSTSIVSAPVRPPASPPTPLSPLSPPTLTVCSATWCKCWQNCLPKC